MYSGFNRGRRIEQHRNLGEIGVGIGADDAWQAARIARLGAKYDCCRPRLAELRQISGLREERDIRGPSGLQCRDLMDAHVRVANQLPAELPDDIAELERFALGQSYLPAPQCRGAMYRTMRCNSCSAA